MTTTDTARNQAQAQLEHIRELMEWHEHVQDCSDDPCNFTNSAYAEYADPDTDKYEHADPLQAIHENALEIAVRDSWHAVGGTGVPREYWILLCTGGPAVRIIGELDDWGEVESARLEYQDWGTPWTEYRIDPNTQTAYTLLIYAQQFYFGA